MEGRKRRDERKFVRRIGGSCFWHRAGYLPAEEVEDQNAVEPLEPAYLGRISLPGRDSLARF